MTELSHFGYGIAAAVRAVFEPATGGPGSRGVPRERCDELAAQVVLGLLDVLSESLRVPRRAVMFGVDPTANPGDPLSAELLAKQVVEALDRAVRANERMDRA